MQTALSGEPVSPSVGRHRSFSARTVARRPGKPSADRLCCRSVRQL